jgi:hypothetical protein
MSVPGLVSCPLTETKYVPGGTVAMGVSEIVGVGVLGAYGGEACTGVVFTIHRLADSTTINRTLKRVLLR